MPGDVPLDHPEFDAIAKWYDFDYERRVRQDLPFWRDCAAEGGGPVLELGAGTGRVTVVLAKDGHDVTAVDLSPEMLESARRRFERAGELPGRVRLVRGDMTSPPVRGKFGTVIAPFRSFNHLYSVDRQLAALRSIRRRLTPDGIGAIALWSPNLAELGQDAGRVQVSYDRTHPSRGTRVVQRFKLQYDYAAQMAYVDYWWDEYRGKRRLQRDHAPMRARWFSRFEFEHLLSRSGLRTLRLYGDFRGGPWREGSEDLIFVFARD
ncbi:MAG: class I SAM-dependent methyltransferase [bacterium]